MKNRITLAKVALTATLVGGFALTACAFSDLNPEQLALTCEMAKKEALDSAKDGSNAALTGYTETVSGEVCDVDGQKQAATRVEPCLLCVSYDVATPLASDTWTHTGQVNWPTTIHGVQSQLKGSGTASADWRVKAKKATESVVAGADAPQGFTLTTAQAMLTVDAARLSDFQGSFAGVSIGTSAGDTFSCTTGSTRTYIQTAPKTQACLDAKPGGSSTATGDGGTGSSSTGTTGSGSGTTGGDAGTDAGQGSEGHTGGSAG